MCLSLSHKHELLPQSFLVKRVFFFPYKSVAIQLYSSDVLKGWASLPTLQRGEFLHFASALTKGFKEVKDSGHTTAVSLRDWAIKEYNVKFEQLNIQVKICCFKNQYFTKAAIQKCILVAFAGSLLECFLLQLCLRLWSAHNGAMEQSRRDIRGQISGILGSNI